MEKPKNYRKPYTAEEKRKLQEIASTLNSKEEMYEILEEIAEEFGRTKAGIAKQIEEIKGWYWAKDK